MFRKTMFPLLSAEHNSSHKVPYPHKAEGNDYLLIDPWSKEQTKCTEN